MPRKTYFSDLWLKLAEYKDWLRKKDDITGQCSNLDPPQSKTIPCQFSIEVKMRRIRREVQILKKTKGKINLHLPVKKNTDDTFLRDNVFFAEIRFVLKTVESNYSQRSCENINELFKVMFPGSIVAEHFKLGRTKCGYLITHGLRNYFLDILYTEI